MTVFTQILHLLEEKHLKYSVLEHDFVHHAEEAANVRGTKLEEAAKAIVVKYNKDDFAMIVVSGHKRIDLKRLKQILNTKNACLASPDDVLKTTGLKIGSVPPFGNLFGLKTFADKLVVEQEKVVFSAGSHYKSIIMQSKDWREAAEAVIEDFSK